MNDFGTLQALLFKWLKHFGSRNREQIRKASRGLLKSYRIDDENIIKYCLSYLLDPLLRKGIIEFVGKGEYRVSPPVILYHKEYDQFVAVNLNNDCLNDLKQMVQNFYVDHFQIARFKGDVSLIRNFARESRVKIQASRISNILSQIPSIVDIIQSFSEYYPNSINGFYFWDIGKRCWEKNGNKLRPGLYKASNEDFSIRYFYGNNHSWRKIPGVEDNPDAVNLAKCAQAILENRNVLHYSWDQKRLSIRCINLPILLDRILRIPSLYKESEAIRGGGSIIYYNVTGREYRYLEKIFCNTELKK